MALRDGAIKGIDIPGTVRRVRAELGGKDAEGVASKTQKTDFTEMTASFAIKNGVAHNDDLSLKSPLLRATGAGDINIGEDSLDYVVNVILVGTLAGQGGKALGELKGLTIPVRLSGPYTALKYKVEFSQMFSGKEQIEAGKELLKKSGEEKLRELGKGFLGGKESPAPSEKPGKAPAKRPEDEMKDRLKGFLGR
jgi:AsmA protein